uniref:Uncharacterized protein n=1 Tax=Sphaerodactylus townsendi TaxID=933632 RepID=A0ACB8EIK2_9SAUR
MSEPQEPAAAAASPQGSGCRCAGGVGRAPTVLSLLLSLLSVGACFLLSARTAKLQGRLVALEGELAGGRPWSPGDPLAAEPLLALLQPQVDKVLQEVVIVTLVMSEDKHQTFVGSKNAFLQIELSSRLYDVRTLWLF